MYLELEIWEIKALTLQLDKIPQFMVNLSTNALLASENITDSSATILTIVDILNTISNLSQTILISQPVMKNFLETTEVIGSDGAQSTWVLINSNSATRHVSSELLKSTEKIATRLSNVNIALSLLIADICFIIGAAVVNRGEGPCSTATFFMHFFYLALFFWMLLSALLLLYRTLMVFSRMTRGAMMAIAFSVGYGAPLIIAVVTVASTAGQHGYIQKNYNCWLNWSQTKALLAFVIPALTIVAINFLVLIVVLVKMLRRGVNASTQQDEKHPLVVIARCVAILTPLFGLTWGFGIGTLVSSNRGIHIVFAFLNSLQGFFILVFGILLDSKVREALAGTFSLRNFSSNRTRSTSEGPSSSGGFPFFRRLRQRNAYNVSSAGVMSSSNSDTAGHSQSSMPILQGSA
ncbi:adhesion G-protein coupled receptor F1-like [Clarias gariepinus]